MLKCMKYEFLRSRMSLFIIGAIFAVLEAVFLVGTLAKSEKTFVIAVAGLWILTVVCNFYIFINGIKSYSSDLKEKSGYLVFMTPASTYRIIGAKLLVILVESAVFQAVFGCFGVLDSILALNRFGNATWGDVVDELMRAFEIPKDEIMYFFSNVGAVLLMSVVFFYALVTVAYLAISLGATVLQNKRGRGVLSFGFFVVLMVALFVIEERIPRWDIDLTTPVRAFMYIWPSLLYFGVVCVAAFIGSAKLLEKKISL